MSTLSSHVLDTTRGQPAANLTVRLEHLDARGTWTEVSRATTNGQGRIAGFTAKLTAGLYRLTFETGPYLQARHAQEDAFYPEVGVVFRVSGEHEHYHIPLLLSPFGYSTYRGS